MEKIKLMDKEFWKYFWLCSKDSGKEWLIHFEGWKKVSEPVGVAITTAILTLMSQKFFNGVLKMSNINIAIISVIGAPILWFCIVYLGKLVFAPFRVYKQQENELEKFNWKKIHCEVCEYDVFKDVGWGIKVTNNKNSNIRVILELDYLRADDVLRNPTVRRHYLGNIEENGQMVKNRIVCESSSGIAEIDNGEEKVFPLTKISNNSVSFLTFPESDRDIEFSSIKSGVLLTVRADVETKDGNFPLLDNKLELHVFPDGSIRPLDKGNSLWA